MRHVQKMKTALRVGAPVVASRRCPEQAHQHLGGAGAGRWGTQYTGEAKWCPEARKPPRRCQVAQGGSPQFPWVLVGPPPVRKCHQMSSKEHMQLVQVGWVVRWVLSTLPGHPTAGRCGRVVPVPPLLLCTRLAARARPSVGGQSPPPAPL
jgi:hypothetical protein